MPKGLIIFALDTEYRYLTFTESHSITMKHIWGVDIAVGMDMLSAIQTQEDRQKAKHNFDRALHGETFTLEEEYGDSHLQRSWWEDRYAPLQDETGKIIGLTVFVIDITERKLMETSLRENETRIRNILESAIDGFMGMDSQGKITEWNPQAARIFGWTRNEVVGKLLGDVIVPEQLREKHQQGLKRFLSTGIGTVLNQRIEIEGLHRDGHTIPVELTIISTLSAGDVSFNAFIRDISERKKAQQNLALSEQKFRMLAESSPIVVYHCKADDFFTFLYLNEAVEQLTGYPRQAFLKNGMTFFDLYHPNDVTEIVFPHGGSSAHRPSFHITYRITHKSGEIRWVDEWGTYITNSAGQSETIVGMMVDVTETRQAISSLQANEQKYRELYDTAQKQTREINLLSAVRNVLARNLDLATLLRNVVEAIAEAFGYALVSLYTVEGDALLLQHQVGYADVLMRIPITDGIMGRVVRRGEPTLVKDVHSDTDFLEAIKGITSEICVPIFDGERVVGVLNVESTKDILLTDDDLRMMIALSQHIGTAIIQARLYGSAQHELETRKKIETDLLQREAILEVVSNAAQTLLKASGWRQEINAILENLGRITRVSHAYLFENHVEEGVAVTSLRFEWAATGKLSSLGDPHFINMLLLEDEFELWTDCMTKGIPYIGDDAHVSENEMTYLRERGMQALLDMPIYVDGKWWGIIGLDDMDTPRKWTNPEMDGLVVAANVISAAIQRQQAEAQLQDELVQRRQAEVELRQREIMLESMATSANRFLNASDWRAEINTVLEDLGKAIHASHAYLFEKHTGANGELLNSLRYEWAAPGQHSDIDNPTYQNAPTNETDFNHYYSVLNSGQPFIGHSSYFKENKWDWSQITGIKAMLEIRIVVNGRQWGTIGVDECVTDREWTQQEVDIIRVLANVLGAAIKRQEDEATLQNELVQRKLLINELESKNSELERFTYTVSHDLKSPLFTIRGFLGYLERDALAGDHDRLHSDIQRIADATDKMQQLLNDLLELSRIGRLVNALQTVNLNRLIDEIVELLHGQITQRNVKVHVQPNLPLVHGDRQRLGEVIQNLIENAVKFMGDQTKPSIEIGYAGADPENNMPIFFVKDNGVGISPEHYDRIFGLFNKLDPQTDGTGIGLALVKRIVEVHGGRIWVQSASFPQEEAGMGSTFFFTLPPQPRLDSVI